MDTLMNWLNGSTCQDDKLQHMKRKAKALSAQAADIKSEVEHEELRPGKRRKREVDNWLKEVNDVEIQLQRLEHQQKDNDFSVSKPGCSIGQATKLTETIGELIQHGSFPRGLTLYDHWSSNVALITTDVKVNDPKFEDNKRKLMSWLTNDDTISIIGVYGSGGVGKTTLLKEIHNELLENSMSSRHVYWVSVSHGTTVPLLQDKVAEALDLGYLLKEKNDIRKAGMLSYEMKRRKNCVLILDDIWEYFPLEQAGIPCGENNCKLILTTRSLDVCRKMKCQEYVKVEPLSQEEGWNLFAKVLAKEIIPSEIKYIAELVAAECAGLPLSIIVMAGSMRGVEDIQEWRNTLEELRDSTQGQADMERDVFPVLKLSYDRLKDPKLRQCFLLCALYPKDSEIQRDELITLFRSEGLLDGIESWQKQFDKAHSMLNKLENVCLMEKCSFGYVKMHNLIREMAIRITKVAPRFMISSGSELRRIPSGRKWTFDLDKVSLMQNSLSEIQPGTIPICPCLSTLLLQRNPFTKLPDLFFVHMKGLKVLNLSHTSMKRLPSSVSELQNLRALLLDFCRRLLFVPSLVKLTNLRELNFSFCWSMRDLPHGMEQLTSLKFLDLEGSKNLCHLLGGGSLAKLSNIQCLKLEPDVQTISGDDIVKLGKLEKLEGCRISDVSSFNRYVKTQHFQKLNNYAFVVGTGEYKRIDYGTQNKTSRILVLCSHSLGESEGRHFFPPENIQNLQIHNCDFSARSLVDTLPSLHSLETLTKIMIRRCRVVEFIWPTPSKVRLPLQFLHELALIDLQDFRGLVEEGFCLPRGAFSNLRILVIKFCPKIKKLFTKSLLKRSLDNLQELKVEGCEELEEIIAITDSDEDDDDVTRFPDLMVLQLRHLPKLITISQQVLMGNGSIERISIEYCANLNKIFIPSLPPHYLRNLSEIKIAGCQNLQEIIATPNFVNQKCSIVELPNLRALVLNDLPFLTSVFPGKLPTCRSVDQISILNCPCLRRFPISIPLFSNEQPLAPPCLQEIIISDKEWWESLDWVNPHLKQVLQPFAKLVDADNLGLEILKELDSTGSHQKLKGKTSTTEWSDTHISSCLTEPSHEDCTRNPDTEDMYKGFKKLHTEEIVDPIMDNLSVGAHHMALKVRHNYIRGLGAEPQQPENEGESSKLRGETDSPEQGATLHREIEELKASNDGLRAEIEHLKADAERMKMEAKERDNKLREELLQMLLSQLALR